MNEKLDKVIAALSNQIDKFIEDFEKSPLSTVIKVCAIMWVVKWAKRNLL